MSFTYPGTILFCRLVGGGERRVVTEAKRREIHPNFEFVTEPHQVALNRRGGRNTRTPHVKLASLWRSSGYLRAWCPVVVVSMLAHIVLSLAQQAQPASQLLSVTHKFEARAPDLAKALARRRDQAPPSNQRPLVFFHLRKSGGSQVRDALRDASRAHNLSSFIPCYNRVPCETYTPPRQMIYNRTAIGSPRYAVLAGHYVHESEPCMAGQRGPSFGLAEADRSSGACSGAQATESQAGGRCPGRRRTAPRQPPPSRVHQSSAPLAKA